MREKTSTEKIILILPEKHEKYLKTYILQNSEEKFGKRNFVTCDEPTHIAVSKDLY